MSTGEPPPTPAAGPPAGPSAEASSHAEDARREQARPRDTPFARRYGAHLWHLLVLLALIAGTAYVVSRLLGNPQLFDIALWFVGAAVVWDLVLGPLLALADRGLRATVGRASGAGVRPVNYVRFPGLISAVLLVVWTPLVFQRSEEVYRLKAGLLQDPYLERWLAVTLVLFAGSAIAFVVAVLRSRRR